MKYRKKPGVIEAMQLKDGTPWKEIFDFASPSVRCKSNDDGQTIVWIKTLEGDLTVSENDWIIKGIKGEFYPCKPDIFEAMYEAVDNPPQSTKVESE